MLSVQFGEAGVTARLQLTTGKHHIVLAVQGISPEAGVSRLVFLDLPLVLKGDPSEPFAACALALNLQTQVRTIPQASTHLWAACYPRFGFAGAKVALVACPQPDLRRVLQEVVSAAPDLPHSPIGGPWALDGPENNGSYLFNTHDLSERTVDKGGGSEGSPGAWESPRSTSTAAPRSASATAGRTRSRTRAGRTA